MVINWRVHKLEQKIMELEREINKLADRAKKQCRHTDRVQTDEGIVFLRDQPIY